MLSGLELRIVSELVKRVRSTECPGCGKDWHLTFAGADFDTFGDEVIVARAVCPDCGVEIEVGKYVSEDRVRHLVK